MKRKLLVLALAAVAAGATLCNAQGRTGSLFINEVMVQNDSNLVDDFGQRSGWIELYNAKFAPLEISSVYITNDPANPPFCPLSSLTALYAVNSAYSLLLINFLKKSR